jgi:hypothetical protein
LVEQCVVGNILATPSTSEDRWVYASREMTISSPAKNKQVKTMIELLARHFSFPPKSDEW